MVVKILVSFIFAFFMYLDIPFFSLSFSPIRKEVEEVGVSEYHVSMTLILQALEATEHSSGTD